MNIQLTFVMENNAIIRYDLTDLVQEDLDTLDKTIKWLYEECTGSMNTTRTLSNGFTYTYRGVVAMSYQPQPQKQL